MNGSENEGYHPLEPTKPVTPIDSGSDFPLTHPYLSTDYLDNPYIIAPPPPKKSHTQFLFMVAILVVAIMFFGASLFFYLAATHQEAVARVAPTTVVLIATPTVQPYTAQDILNEMIAHKLIVVGSDYGESLSYFFADPLYNSAVNTPFQSSVIWSVWSGQTPGSCPDACIGLWVYSSYGVAASVEQKLNADGILAQQTPAQGPTVSRPALFACSSTLPGVLIQYLLSFVSWLSRLLRYACKRRRAWRN